jgi:light-regulated signal transduction histidine kinase (bacteriophytochrome)
MKPLLTEDQDGATLQNLGRASLQIIHDIKNQLNGLKLYATYLRKRVDKTDQAAELQETVTKLIGGLDRAANDLNVLVQYGRPLALKKQPGVDIQKLMRVVSTNLAAPANGGPDLSLVVESDLTPLVGEFDPAALADAFNTICSAALKRRSMKESDTLKVALNCERLEAEMAAVIEWTPVSFEDGDPFRSFQGSDAIRMSLAAKIIEAHGGSAEQRKNLLRVRLPLS